MFRFSFDCLGCFFFNKKRHKFISFTIFLSLSLSLPRRDKTYRNLSYGLVGAREITMTNVVQAISRKNLPPKSHGYGCGVSNSRDE